MFKTYCKCRIVGREQNLQGTHNGSYRSESCRRFPDLDNWWKPEGCIDHHRKRESADVVQNRLDTGIYFDLCSLRHKSRLVNDRNQSAFENCNDLATEFPVEAVDMQLFGSMSVGECPSP